MSGRGAMLAPLLAARLYLPLQTPAQNLNEAKRLYEEGRFGLAVARLQALVLSLASDSSFDARPIREEAYLYFGLSYVALDDPEAARASFRELLQLSPERRLDPAVHAPKVVETFEAARAELAREGSREKASSPAPSLPKSPGGGSSKGPSRGKWLLVGAVAGGSGAAAATLLTGGDTTTSVPAANVEVDMRLNGVKQGSFSCGQGLLFTLDVINRTDQLLHVESFTIAMNSLSSECLTHVVAIDGAVGLELLPGARMQIRRVDLAGDVCFTSPGRRPGCSWRSVASVMTSAGAFSDEVQFSTMP